MSILEDEISLAMAAENPEEKETMSTASDHLPRVVSCGMSLFKWKGFWMYEELFKAAEAMRDHFEPNQDDIILTSFPKTGTTWLKALIHTILRSSTEEDPLVELNPHELVPVLELQMYPGNPNLMDQAPPPRIFQTHFPFEILPEPVKKSGCKIVYVARNPADTLVSLWQFTNKRNQGTNYCVSLEEAFHAFCEGTVADGPYLDHVLGYWKERTKIFFITYEELKEDPYKHIARLAEFLGRRSLSEEEVRDVEWRCSLDRLRGVKANRGRKENHWSGYPYEAFFRRGMVGDWKNHLSQDMIERLMVITNQKLDGSGLQFKWEMETTSTAPDEIINN
ncbi:hypothetical protein H6P81_016643 [Aristolochia fimbriata]|uniref:Sulfotransferase n=1 Tax=Aristolochia fimbriata TaxID=158543 RepID=A0AAV7E9A6_ARIFI|nr:hypothetical protein H6P81_016643 [Aristolochia fimbriata]